MNEIFELLNEVYGTDEENKNKAKELIKKAIEEMSIYAKEVFKEKIDKGKDYTEISELTKKIQGIKDKLELEENIISSNMEQLTVETLDNIKGREVVSYIFKDKTYEVENNRELLRHFCRLIAKEHKDVMLDCADTEGVKGRQKTYLSTCKDNILKPIMVGEELYLESEIDTDMIVKIIRKLLEFLSFYSITYKDFIVNVK